MMYKTIARLYQEGRLSENGVRNAAKMKMITDEECQQILDGKSDK